MECRVIKVTALFESDGFGVAVASALEVVAGYLNVPTEVDYLTVAHQTGFQGAQLRKHIDATLGSGNLREAVRLPPGEDINEWLAVNSTLSPSLPFYISCMCISLASALMIEFFFPAKPLLFLSFQIHHQMFPGIVFKASRNSNSSEVNLLYGTLTEFCTPENCPTMTAGPKYEYRWADGVQIKKPIEVSAPKYVEYLMDWIETQLDDESLFPQRLGEGSQFWKSTRTPHKKSSTIITEKKRKEKGEDGYRDESEGALFWQIGEVMADLDRLKSWVTLSSSPKMASSFGGNVD
ncbi:MOB kinase activator-like 1A [Capsicum annuum]|nr:MOB kinase activator-like 1A [Capsicum annuum]